MHIQYTKALPSKKNYMTKTIESQKTKNVCSADIVTKREIL